MVGVSPNTLCLSHFINALPAGLVYAVVGAALLGGSARPMLPHTSVVLVFIALLLHFATVVALAFAFAYVIDTSLMSPTSGRVLVNGKDTRSQQKEVRSQLGLCPQHNLFFSDLTVLEHIKGGTYGDARVSAENLLKKLNLQDKVDARTDQLSGGMKRRLQLACALAGGASVLVLDEPTSGLDVETRRELWDLLLVRHGAAGTLAGGASGLYWTSPPAGWTWRPDASCGTCCW
ncbi:hypothetical protein MSG28_014712 [Choristoneura fumiferana]|uniref:Uncharacterized protein n=1 Tax=Choristoneura fumiferana TaxID=7141 RepID=A0ACC0JSF8_CHOFU|nr:hypothetical protein MSG28_014712 [Choristoneura fumiferana]